jgi:hypothetical protein
LDDLLVDAVAFEGTAIFDDADDAFEELRQFGRIDLWITNLHIVSPY